MGATPSSNGSYKKMNKMTKLSLIRKLNKIDCYIRLVLLISTTHLDYNSKQFPHTRGHYESIIKISLFSIIFQKQDYTYERTVNLAI